MPLSEVRTQMEKQMAGETISQGRPGAAVGCVLCAKSLQLCLTLCDPMA